MLSASEVAGELISPLRSASTMLVFGLLLFLLMLVSIASFLHPILGFAVSLTIGFAVLPAFVRVLVYYLDARARNRYPESLSVEHFSWMSDRWSLFPVALFAAAGCLLFWASQSDVQILLPLAVVVLLVCVPASLVVLTMTHSPLQSLHPFALGRLVHRLGAAYLLAPVIVLAVGAIIFAIRDQQLLVLGAVTFYGLLVCFGLFGALLRPEALADEVDLPEMVVDVGIPAHQIRRRESALNLAYSFMSRDGIENGIKHIESAIAEEQGDSTVWHWYFERMLGWENPYFACRFAQRYIKELLLDGDVVGMIKIIRRCRMLDERFKPVSEDIPAVQAALVQAGHTELANSLLW